MIQLVVEGFSEENRVRVSDRHAIYALVRSSTGGRRDIEVSFDDNSDRTLITISSVGNTLSEENKKTIHQKTHNRVCPEARTGGFHLINITTTGRCALSHTEGVASAQIK